MLFEFIRAAHRLTCESDNVQLVRARKMMLRLMAVNWTAVTDTMCVTQPDLDPLSTGAYHSQKPRLLLIPRTLV